MAWGHLRSPVFYFSLTQIASPLLMTKHSLLLVAIGGKAQLHERTFQKQGQKIGWKLVGSVHSIQSCKVSTEKSQKAVRHQGVSEKAVSQSPERIGSKTQSPNKSLFLLSSGSLDVTA